MKSIKNAGRVIPIFGLAVLLAAEGSPAMAGGHTWQVSELFSNADGTIQFVELKEPAGATGETAVSNYFVTSNARSYDIQTNISGNTALKTLCVRDARLLRPLQSAARQPDLRFSVFRRPDPVFRDVRRHGGLQRPRPARHFFPAVNFQRTA
jgi:hypothetical protein